MQTSTKQTVLVVGGTGQQGGAVVTALLSTGGFEVHALTRSPTSRSALALAARGVKLVQGDLADKASLVTGLRASSATCVFLVTDFWIAAKQDMATEIQHGKNMVDAVAAVDPSIFVLFSSVGSADAAGEKVQHFYSKWLIEQYLSASDVKAWAVLRPCAFLEGVDDPRNYNPLTKGHVKFVTAGQTRVKYVSVIDIGKAAASMLANRATWNGKVFEFATSEHSGVELAAALSEVSGIKCSYSEAMPKEQMLELMPDVYHMVRFFEQVGYSADVAAGRELVGPSAMDAKAWFKHKGQWADGEKFGATTAVSAQPTKSELMLNVQSWWRVLSCGA